MVLVGYLLVALLLSTAIPFYSEAFRSVAQVLVTLLLDSIPPLGSTSGCPPRGSPMLLIIDPELLILKTGAVVITALAVARVLWHDFTSFVKEVRGRRRR